MGEPCSHCGTAGAEARCGKCKQAIYCGRECQVAGWKGHKAVCKQRQQEAEFAKMEAHIAALDAACGGHGSKLKGKKKREKLVGDLQQTDPQAAAAAAAAVAAHNQTTRSMLRHMAGENFEEVVLMQEDVLEAIKTLELMGKNGPALGLLNDLGTAHRNLGQYQAAISCYQHGVDFARRVNDKKSELQMMTNMVAPYGLLGNSDKQVEVAEIAIALSRATTETDAEAKLLEFLASRKRNGEPAAVEGGCWGDTATTQGEGKEAGELGEKKENKGGGTGGGGGRGKGGGGAAGAGAGAGAGGIRKIVNREELDQAVKDAGQQLVVLNFGAKWCEVCKKIEHFYAQLGTDPKVVETGAQLYAIDVDLSPDLTSSGMSQLPLFVFLKKGKKVDSLVGAQNTARRNKILKLASS